MKLIMLGAPGAGKGTQAAKICEKYNIPTISTGAIIRNAIRNATDIGKQAKSLIDKGLLVPDEVVIGIIKERLAEPDCKNGFILDGFPRTIAQAEALETMGISIDKALSIEVPDEVILDRLGGRRECSECGATYHVHFNPSKDGDKCEKCGGALITRPDDCEETIMSRLKVYHETTEVLKEFYENKGKLVKIDGDRDVEEITKDVLDSLD
ncbi:MAG: adenylate kinase [Clostridia bacterium]|nr:adenylate kinase [Clostridia bacterium]